MPLRNSGKTITKINVNKKKVVLYFEKDKMEISPDAYTLSYLYVGKTLTNKEIADLKDFSSLTKLMNYAMSLLKKGHYSEWKMREKLYNKDANKKSVDKIIDRLKANDLINDAALIEDYLCYAEEKLIGKNKIIKELSNKGIFEKDINKIKFSRSKEKKKALSQLPKLERKYCKESYDKKKQHIYGALLSLGFEKDIVLEVMNKISSKNDNDEQNKIKSDYKKLVHRLSARYEGNELNQKVFISLKNKGYRYNDIKKIMEVNSNDDFSIC